MTQATNRLGRSGEELAARHLARLGYTIEARNWRAADAGVRGELDIVARDGGTLVFCEVKTSRASSSLDAFAAVGFAKQRQIRRLAALYLTAATRRVDVRFDVLAVTAAPGGMVQVEHIVGAF